MMAPLLLGLASEATTVRIQVLEDVFDNVSHPARFARVAVSDRRLEVYSAELELVAHLQGLAYVMHTWFVSSSLVGVWAAAIWLGTLSCGAAGLALFGWLQWQQRRQRLRDGAVVAAVAGDTDDTARLPLH